MENASTQQSVQPKAEVQQPVPQPQQQGGFALDVGILVFVTLTTYLLSKIVRAIRPMTHDLAIIGGGFLAGAGVSYLVNNWIIGLTYAIPATAATLIIHEFLNKTTPRAAIAEIAELPRRRTGNDGA